MNVNSVMRSIEDENTITVYLKQEITTLEAVKIGQEIQQLPNVKDTQFVSADEGLQQYEEMLGPLFEGLEEEEDVYKRQGNGSSHAGYGRPSGRPAYRYL